MKCYTCRKDKNIWTDLYTVRIKKDGWKQLILECMECLIKRDKIKVRYYEGD
ncbi:hypothetical protein KAR91_56300 [Candidatus Pacearchaeota archaeon]|nr:hypothetical protein [Candidatus Pacearchaeota archaeon]